MTSSSNKYVLSCVGNALLRDFPPRWKVIIQAFKILMNILKEERRRILNERRLKLKIPKTVILSVTRNCNLSCRGCYAINNTYKNQLNTEEIQRIINDANRLGSYIFVITGGEPLMVPDLISLLAKNKSVLFLLITNGTLINEQRISQIKKTWNILPVISVDGDRNQVENRRNSGTWQKIQSAMSLFRLHHTTFGVSIMLTHQNIRKVLNVDWMNSIWKKGARFGFLLDYLPFDHSHTLSYEFDKCDFLLKRTLLENLRIKSPFPLFIFPEGEHCNSNCFFLKDQLIHINANGMVEPCPFCQVAMDSIRTKPLEEILKSDFFKLLHREFNNKHDQNVSCVLFNNIEIINSISEEIQTAKAEIIN
jgi:MoaA/NifB/PqqE/SkfB family radical SAM enzyme